MNSLTASDSLANYAVCIAERFWLTTLDAEEAATKLLSRTDCIKHLFITVDEETTSDLMSFPKKLGHVFQFSKLILPRPTSTFVVCINPGARSLTNAALLLGGYLLICEKMGLDRIADAFNAVSSHFLTFLDAEGGDNVELTVFDCWAALQRATALGWLDFSDEPSEDAIDMDECLHYDSVANGGLHVVVPNKLLAFPPPTDIGDGCAWVDEGGARRFSPSYYADVLGDFDVAVAVSCAGAGSAASYDAAAMEDRGIAVEVLAADARSGRLLASVDRVLTLARAAPGAMALHGAGGWEEGLLLSAYLIRMHGFSARHAIAWARMTHPRAPVPAPRLALHRFDSSRAD
jgi:hypothetical protein